MRNCALLCDSIYYIVALNFTCGALLCSGPQCGMQVECMCICSTHQGLVSQLIPLQQCRPYDVKYIESNSHSSVYTMFVLGIIYAMVEFKTVWPSSSNLCRN